MADGTILNIGVVPDPDDIDIPANDAVVPDAGMVTDLNIADDLGAFGDVYPLT
jgi:hypothetical protein